MRIPGLHHVTAIAGEPQQCIDFYTGTLGLRMTKLTVNFDDPGTYHFYFTDAAGAPGTNLTFFPWMGMEPGRVGVGQTAATAFVVPADAIGYWRDRLTAARAVVGAVEPRFGEEVLSFQGPDGLKLEIVGERNPPDFAWWEPSGVPQDKAIRGFHGVTLSESGYEHTSKMLTDILGYQFAGEEGNRFRFLAKEGPRGRVIDLLCLPDARRGNMGTGTVHHIALRAHDEQEQLLWREKLVDADFNVSPVLDRFYFRSIYFREPGGVIFEIATDGPGMAIDEAPGELGTKLMLPKQHECRREELMRILPPLRLPKGNAS